MEKYLDMHTDEAFDIAKNVYEHGAFSRSYALLDLEKPLPSVVQQGTVVKGYTRSGDRVTGTVRRLMPAGQTELDVLYEMDDDEDPSTGCYVGANPEPVVDECMYMLLFH